MAILIHARAREAIAATKEIGHIEILGLVALLGV